MGSLQLLAKVLFTLYRFLIIVFHAFLQPWIWKLFRTLHGNFYLYNSMKATPSPVEPSLEDILASIRRMIDEEEAEQALEPDAPPLERRSLAKDSLLTNSRNLPTMLEETLQGPKEKAVHPPPLKSDAIKESTSMTRDASSIAVSTDIPHGANASFPQQQEHSAPFEEDFRNFYTAPFRPTNPIKSPESLASIEQEPQNPLEEKESMLSHTIEKNIEEIEVPSIEKFMNLDLQDPREPYCDVGSSIPLKVQLAKATTDESPDGALQEAALPISPGCSPDKSTFISVSNHEIMQPSSHSSTIDLSPHTIAATKHALERLTDQLHVHHAPEPPAAVTAWIEAITRELLKTWMDANLPGIVEKTVQETLSRLIRDKNP